MMPDRALPASLTPRRPERPAGIPMVGDGKRELWKRWLNACDLCKHAHPKWGCIRLGTLLYDNGAEFGFALVPGGCKSWTPREA